jgi:uncharacterized protein involved in outer membrane biogenesis
MKITALTLAVSLIPVAYMATAQDCASSFFPSKEGTKIEMTSYDKNGKETGKSVTTLISIRKSGTEIEYTLKSETTNSRNTNSTMEYNATCDGNTVSVSMKSFIPSEMQKSSGGGEMTIDANNILFPNSINVGQKLNNGNVTLTVSVGTMTMKTIVNIINRTVTGKENITTPEGNFDCYKIEYDVESTVMNMKINSKVRQWIAKGVGTVKSENYNEKGDLISYSQVTSIK